MPVLYRIERDERDFEDLLLAFNLRNANRVIAQALNDTARQARTEASRAVSRHTSMKVGTVKKAMKVHLAKPGDRQATVTASGRPVLLYKMGGARQTKKGVSIKVWGKRKVYTGTFIATMPGGHKGTFSRKTDARLPIKELYGPGIPQTLADPEIDRALQSVIAQRLRSNVVRQADRRARALAGKGGR